MIKNPAPPTFLGEIALSLSGGGYRAAAFHLGVLAALDDLDLLAGVQTLSTVSGGTITGMLYAVSVAENRDFNDFYRQLYAFLRDRNVISEAFRQLSTDRRNLSAPPSLIKAAADVYASDALLGNRKFALLLDSDDPRLSELVFNATDFRHGLSFRFEKSRSALAVTGNGNARINRAVAREIRLADIVAASSCFPSVFEPLQFPDDFAWSEPLTAEKARKLLGPVFEQPISLMDGGIFDNQGIDSVLQIYRREGKEIGLLLVSDTDRHNPDIFNAAAPRSGSRLTLRHLVVIAWALGGVSLITALSLLVDAAAEFADASWLKLIFVNFFPFLLAAGVVAALFWIRRLFAKLQNLADAKAKVGLWQFLKFLTVADAVALLEARINSLIALSSSIFMKRIRDLTYLNLATYPKYNNKKRTNLIYDLTEAENYGKLIREKKIQPSRELLEIVEEAKDYETNLWFFDERKLKNIVICGQATTCFNILRHLLAHYPEELLQPDSPAAALYTRTLRHWETFNRSDESAPLR